MPVATQAGTVHATGSVSSQWQIQVELEHQVEQKYYNFKSTTVVKQRQAVQVRCMPVFQRRHGQRGTATLARFNHLFRVWQALYVGRERDARSSKGGLEVCEVCFSQTTKLNSACSNTAEELGKWRIALRIDPIC